jgi:hypothetical protein
MNHRKCSPDPVFSEVLRLSNSYLLPRNRKTPRETLTTGYDLEDGGIGVRVPVGTRIFSSPVVQTYSVLGLTQLRIQWVPAALYPGAQQPEREADHSLPSSVKARKPGSIHSFPIRLHYILLN